MLHQLMLCRLQDRKPLLPMSSRPVTITASSPNRGSEHAGYVQCWSWGLEHIGHCSPLSSAVGGKVGLICML
jgi:hypothetical protein